VRYGYGENGACGDEERSKASGLKLERANKARKGNDDTEESSNGSIPPQARVARPAALWRDEVDRGEDCHGNGKPQPDKDVRVKLTDAEAREYKVKTPR